MLWTKQCYLFDADTWLREHNVNPFSGMKPDIRKHKWSHMINQHVISMPDKWEYP